MRKSISNQSEIAFTAYIEAIIAGTILPPTENPTAATTLALVNCYAYQQVITIVNPNPGQTDVFENVLLPSLIFQAHQPDQIAYDCGIFEVKLTAKLETQTDDELDASGPDIHHQRVEALRDCLEDWAYISAGINAPASGPDNRAVQSYTLSSIVFDPNGEMEELKGRRFITVLTYNLEACAQDAPTS